MILHSATTENGRAYLLKLEPGAGENGKDLISLQGITPEGKAVPMAAVFHGADTIRWLMKELESALKKYEAWQAKQIPPAEGETSEAR
ncbi:hypothetical protein EKK58_00315 [Candidatus Dependentiae bacterium]|nr:MAG: hypothetical protein EKK58_00315 [Candidatus Dependentiae bacterium]